ncbi:MAG: EsaB/YukD family protein [Clostridium sp.]|uniref:EsaB/YukD family protein n=1 Tax=Clostridium sp. TaxID=1506 RepID=UPI003EE6E175
MEKGIVLVNLDRTDYQWELEIPLNISVKELCSILKKTLKFEELGVEVSGYYVRTENPTCFLKGNDILKNFKIGFGSKIVII